MSRTSSDVNFKLVIAGAGTGKTTNLVAQVADWFIGFFDEHQRFPHILVSTFTVAATAELRERILVAAMNHSHPQFFRFALSRSHLRITTLLAFFQDLLKKLGQSEWCWEPNIRPPDPRIRRREWQSIIWDEIRRLSAAEATRVWRNFTFEELVIAIEKLTNHNQIRAADRDWCESDLRARLNQLLSQLDFIENVIQDRSIPKSWQSAIQHLAGVYDGLKHSSDVDSIVNLDWTLPRKPSTGKVAAELKSQVIEAFDEVRNFKEEWLPFLLNRTEWLETNRILHQLIQRSWARMTQLEMHTGTVPLASWEQILIDVIQKKPEALKEAAAEWDFWLLDEYQDTNRLQHLILKFLTQQQSYYIVGDPQQSIYAFRGAEPELLEQEFAGAPVACREKLMINYRSQPQLMKFLNRFFESHSRPQTSRSSFQVLTPGREVEALNSRTDPPQFSKNDVEFYLLAPSSADGIGEEDIVLAKLRECIRSGVAAKDIAVLARTRLELAKVAGKLALNGIPYFLHGGKNWSQQQEVLDAMSLLRFIVQPDDSDNLSRLLSHPALAVGLDDVGRWRRNSRKQGGMSLWCWLTQQHQMNQGCWLTQQHQMNQWCWLTQQHEINPQPTQELNDIAAKTCAQLHDLWELGQSRGILAAFREGSYSLGFIRWLSMSDATGQMLGNWWKYYDEVVGATLSSEFSWLRVSDMGGRFAEEADASGDEAQTVAQVDAVQLMTVHGSKGLQFPFVVVMGLMNKALGRSNQVAPLISVHPDSNHLIHSFRASDSTGRVQRYSTPWQKHIQDELQQVARLEADRLLYVAFTRAEERLVGVGTLAEDLSKTWVGHFEWPWQLGEFTQDQFSYACWDAKTYWDKQEHLGQLQLSRPSASVNAATIAVASPSESLMPPIPQNEGVRSMSVSAFLQQAPISESAYAPQLVPKTIEFDFRAYRMKNGLGLLSPSVAELWRIYAGEVWHQALQIWRVQETSQVCEFLRAHLGRNDFNWAQILDVIQNASRPSLYHWLKSGQAEVSFRDGSRPDAVLEGQMDLWFRDASGSPVVVDYKTHWGLSGKKSSDAFSQASASDFYSAQLSVYAKALSAHLRENVDSVYLVHFYF